jgi:hypothetical protein
MFLQLRFSAIVTLCAVHCALSVKSEGKRKLPNKQCTAAFSANSINTLVLQGTTCAMTYLGLVAYCDRPRGKLSIDNSFIEERQSQVEGGGLGLYAATSMSEGTVLGTYPGVLRPAAKFLNKYENVPNTATYTWRLTDNRELIDPTDRNGELQNICLGGTPDFPLSYFLHEKILRRGVPTLLARINEPPLGGGGCNICSSENLETREVTFALSRDVYEGEELFMDYGLTYDRSSYGGD